eukprot:4347526-Pyramimonas_sp.AAC.1
MGAWREPFEAFGGSVEAVLGIEWAFLGLFWAVLEVWGRLEPLSGRSRVVLGAIYGSLAGAFRSPLGLL